MDAFFRVSGKPRKYCSSCISERCGCGNAKALAAVQCLDCERKRRQNERTTFVCKQCGVTYIPKVTNRNQFCSVTCRNRAIHVLNAKRMDYSKRRPGYPSCLVYFPECTQCRRRFTAQTKTKHLCSEPCKKADEVLSNMARHSGKRTCKECSTVFPVEYRDKTRFCSIECGHVAGRRSKRKAKNHRGGDRHRHRARKYGVAYEPIQLIKVLERDGWKCGLCTQPISRDAQYPDPMMPSLDHIIPMSKGGSHTHANVQAAHHRCNTLKRDTMPQPQTAA